MKQTLIKTVVLVFAISASLASCKKDKVETKNSFKYNQKESEIGTTMGFQFGALDGGVYGIGVEFFEKTFTVHYVNGLPDSLSGKGDLLELTFLTNNETQIASGVYNFLDLNTATSLKAFSIAGGLYVNVDAADSSNPVPIGITGGKVTVTKNSDEYEFTFDLNTNANTKITGYYKGKTVIYTDGKKKSSSSNSGFFNPLR